MQSMKKLTQLVLRWSLKNEKYATAKLNMAGCYTLFNRNNHTYQQIYNTNNNEFKNKDVHSAEMKQSSMHFASKNLWSKIGETFSDDLPDMKALFPEIVQELMNGMIPFSIPESVDRFKQVLEYNVAGGKNLRAGLLIKTYKSLKKDITATDLKLAYIIGWCLELKHSFFLILDDIMDGSETRRNQLCWYKVKDVGFTAINDSLVIEQCVYYLLKKHFSHLDCYMDLVHLFHYVTYITTCGQANDLLSANENVEAFTREKYLKIVLHKTAYYTIFMPVVAATYLAGCKEKNLYDELKNILLEIGLLFQIQDDVLDCFGAKEITGKIGTDITENKRTWLAVECMHRANENQKIIMKECYGSNDPKKIAQIKQLYMDLDLLQVYADYERETFNKIKQSLNEASENIPKDTILKILGALVNN